MLRVTNKKFSSAVNEALVAVMKKDENGCVKGNLLCSTITENKDFMKELLNVDPIVFRPSIPNLVY